MVDLSEEERDELERLRAAVGDDVDLPPRPAIPGEFAPIDPMLAETLDGPFDAVDEDECLAETKYDGTRLVVEKFDDEVRCYTRRAVDRADAIPEVVGAIDRLRSGLVLDGELTHLDPSGTSTFQPIHTASDELRRRELTPTLFVFDVLYEGEDVTGLPLEERKARLDDAAADAADDRLVVAPYRTDDFAGFFREVTDAGEEGLVIKRRESRYYPGVRSSQWLKVKRFTERDAVAVGYTEGRGAREDTFGSLVLTDGERCVGRVGTGFTEAELASLAESFEPVDERPVTEAEAGMVYRPVEPFVVQVRYQELTDDRKLRAPVFVRSRPDKPAEDVQPVES